MVNRVTLYSKEPITNVQEGAVQPLKIMGTMERRSDHVGGDARCVQTTPKGAAASIHQTHWR